MVLDWFIGLLGLGFSFVCCYLIGSCLIGFVVVSFGFTCCNILV